MSYRQYAKSICIYLNKALILLARVSFIYLEKHEVLYQLFYIYITGIKIIILIIMIIGARTTDGGSQQGATLYGVLQSLFSAETLPIF